MTVVRQQWTWSVIIYYSKSRVYLITIHKRNAHWKTPVGNNEDPPFWIGIHNNKEINDGSVDLLHLYRSSRSTSSTIDPNKYHNWKKFGIFYNHRLGWRKMNWNENKASFPYEIIVFPTKKLAMDFLVNFAIRCFEVMTFQFIN